MDFRTDDHYEEERQKVLARRVAAEEAKKRREAIKRGEKPKETVGRVAPKPRKANAGRNKKIIIGGIIAAVIIILALVGVGVYLFYFTDPGENLSNTEHVEIDLGEGEADAIEQAQKEATDQISEGSYVNLDGSNWMELSDKSIDDMTSDQVKFMSLEVNLLSKIERIERQNGFLQGTNPNSGESLADYVHRVEDAKDELDIRGFYCNMYYGRNELAAWTLRYCQKNFTEDFPYVVNYNDFSQFLLEYVQNYYKYQKNNLLENNDLNNEIRNYLKSIDKDENGFYILPFKNTFVNHKEDYMQYVPDYVAAEDIRGGDDGKGAVTFFYNKVAYDFTQDKSTGDVYFYVRNSNKTVQDKVNFANRWDKTKFIYVIETVQSSDIDIDKMLEKGYIWVDYDSKEHKKVKNALIKEDVLQNKKHVILVEPVDNG